MGTRALLRVQLSLILDLLLLWQSPMISNAMDQWYQTRTQTIKPHIELSNLTKYESEARLENIKQHELPDLTKYESHFPAIIPDLNLFLHEQRKKHGNVGVNGRRENHPGRKRKHVSIRTNATVPFHKANDGKYVLDLLNDWDGRVEVWNNDLDEINVSLEPEAAWTQELVQYRFTKRTTLIVSLPYQVKGKGMPEKLYIVREPFGTSGGPGKGRLIVWQLINKLPCHFFRLSKWVFSSKLGALAMVYVQIKKENVNMLARLLLIHVPRQYIRQQKERRVPDCQFVLWIYQDPTDLRPKREDEVDLFKLVAAMETLAIKEDKEDDLNNTQFIPHQDSYNLLSSGHSQDSFNQPLIKKDEEDYQMAYWKTHDPDMAEAATILQGMRNVTS